MLTAKVSARELVGTRVYTDHAIFDVTDDAFAVVEVFGDNTVSGPRALTGLDLVDATSGQEN